MKLLRRLYDWVLSWADSPFGGVALFFIALVESSIFPIPPDVLLIALALSKPDKAFRYALICTIGSIIGAIIGYFIGFALWQIVGDFFFAHIPGFTREVFKKVCDSYEQNAVFIVFTAGFTPIPYKVITISAGVSKISMGTFIVASFLSRGLRFFLVGGLIKKFGEPVKTFIEKYFNILTILVVVIYILGFYFLKFFSK